MAAILKIVKLPYPRENIVGFLQNLVYYRMYEPDEVFKSAIAES